MSLKVMVTLEEYVSPREVREVVTELNMLLSEHDIQSEIHSDTKVENIEKIWSSKGRRIGVVKEVKLMHLVLDAADGTREILMPSGTVVTQIIQKMKLPKTEK